MSSRSFVVDVRKEFDEHLPEFEIEFHKLLKTLHEVKLNCDTRGDPGSGASLRADSSRSPTDCTICAAVCSGTTSQTPSDLLVEQVDFFPFLLLFT